MSNIVLKGTIAKEYNSKGTGKRVYVYHVNGSERQLAEYKAAQGTNYREDEQNGNKPLYFHTPNASNGNFATAQIDITIAKRYDGTTFVGVINSTVMTQSDIEQFKAAKINLMARIALGLERPVGKPAAAPAPATSAPQDIPGAGPSADDLARIIAQQEAENAAGGGQPPIPPIGG